MLIIVASCIGTIPLTFFLVSELMISLFGERRFILAHSFTAGLDYASASAQEAL